MPNAFICDATRTPFGRYVRALSDVRADDRGAARIKTLIECNPGVDWRALDDVIHGCATHSGEDNRNFARTSALAGLPVDAPGATTNRPSGSGLDADSAAARAIKTDEARLMIACGVGGMTRDAHGGTIALGHTLGASSARPVTTTLYQLARTKGRFTLCTICIGVGQGVALAIEHV